MLESFTKGEFNEAEKMLGHKWLIKGQVIAGDKRGRVDWISNCKS